MSLGVSLECPTPECPRSAESPWSVPGVPSPRFFSGVPNPRVSLECPAPECPCISQPQSISTKRGWGCSKKKVMYFFLSYFISFFPFCPFVPSFFRSFVPFFLSFFCYLFIPHRKSLVCHVFCIYDELQEVHLRKLPSPGDWSSIPKNTLKARHVWPFGREKLGEAERCNTFWPTDTAQL